MAETIDSVFRDFNTPGNPGSGDYEPEKPRIRALLRQLQGQSGAAITRNTLASLQAITPPSENYMGIVLDDPDAENNGYYYRQANAWVFGRGFPDTFARVELSGTGTAQTGSVNTGVNPANIEVFFAFVATPNTGPLTLSIHGEPPREVVNLAGNPLAAGEWTGTVMFALRDGKYQLLLDAGSALSAAQSASEAGLEADRAEAARDGAETAQQAAEDAVSSVSPTEYPNIATAQALTPLVAPAFIRTAGYHASGDGGGALYAKVAVEPTHAGKFSITLDDGVTVVWYGLADEKVTPYQFGARGDDASDDGPAINAFWAYLAKARKKAEFVGNFKTSVPIIAADADFEEATAKTIVCDAVVTSTYTDLEGTLITFRNWRHSNFVGRIWAMCGDFEPSTRRQLHGIAVQGCFRSHFDYLRTFHSLHDGVVTRGVPAERINNNVTSHGIISAYGCGYAQEVTVASRVHTGSAGSVGQRTVLTLSIPDEFEQTDLVTHDGKDYLITDIDRVAGTVSVFPWIPGLANGGTVTLKVGGGLFIYGADNNVGTINRVDVSACPVGVKYRSVFAVSIDTLHYNSRNTVGWVNPLGTSLAYPLNPNPASQIRGGAIGNLYTETHAANCQVLCTSIAETSFHIGVMDGDDAQLGNVRQLSPASGTTSAPVEAYTERYKGRISIKGDTFGPSGSIPRNGSSSNITISNRKELWRSHRNTQQVTLEWDDDVNRLFGNDCMMFVQTGTTTDNGNPTGTINFVASGGATVNGSSSYEFTGLTRVGVWMCAYSVATNNWFVSLVNGTP